MSTFRGLVQGRGGIGKQVVSSLKTAYPSVKVIAIGTNAQATLQMVKAGADEGASGENPVIVASKMADVIIGPVGMSSLTRCSGK